MSASLHTTLQPAPGNGRSAYPFAVEDLLPQVQIWAQDLGRIPSRNEIMRRWKIGAPKAKQLLDALATTTAKPQPSTPHPEIAPDFHNGMAGDSVSVLAIPAVDPLPNPAQAPDSGCDSVHGHRGVVSVRAWPLLLIAIPAMIAIWSGWVGLGNLAGFGQVRLLPGIWDDCQINTAITLPICVETYATYALKAWLTPGLPERTRTFARYSALGSLGLGMAGQIAYHLMTAAGITHAPWPITTAVACLPVAVLGMAAGLAHLLRTSQQEVTP